MTSSRLFPLTLLAAALLVSPAAAQEVRSGETVSEETTEARPLASNESTTLHVRNNNWLDMRVYVVRHGSRVLLGTVTSFQDRTFELPTAALGGGGSGARVVADPIGSRRGWASDPLSFFPGDRLELTLLNHLAISHLSIRDGRGQ